MPNVMAALPNIGGAQMATVCVVLHPVSSCVQHISDLHF